MHKSIAIAALSRRQRMQGLTLVEILVVVVIIGILAAMVVLNLESKPDQARIAAAQQDLSTLSTALRFYKIDNRALPTTQQGLAALVAKPTIPPIPPNYPNSNGYLAGAKVPKDPWGNEYQYITPGQHNEFDIVSYGADGQPGGEGADADIGTWMLN
jgi:general secretion pathway protein G